MQDNQDKENMPSLGSSQKNAAPAQSQAQTPAIADGTGNFAENAQAVPEEKARVLQKAGNIPAESIEPTDQSFVFAVPGEAGFNFVGDDSTLASPAKTRNPASENARPAMVLAEVPDADIPWRGLSAAHIADHLSTGVLPSEEHQDLPRGIYATDPGLFGPQSGFDEEETEEACKNHELVLGVKFRQYGSVYFFRAGQERIKTGGKVLVETEQGLSLAEVVNARRMRLPLPKIRTPEGDEVEIKPITGLAGPEDIAAAADNKILAASSRLFCKECIRERKLDMKLVDVEVLHDRSKIIFYFTAPTRIDFRELVKDLVRNYRTRIELRQIGVRHETQMLGALGNCGMACCCRRYLRRFAPVTIKMAKEQNLFLNPAKLSGICGRLLCCLANEQENYEEFHKNSPKIGKRYQTGEGQMKVLRANLFRQSIVAVTESGEEREFQLDEWHALTPVRIENKPEPGQYPQEAAGNTPTADYDYATGALPGVDDASGAALEHLLDGDEELQGATRKQNQKPAPAEDRQQNQRQPRDRGGRPDQRGRDNRSFQRAERKPGQPGEPDQPEDNNHRSGFNQRGDAGFNQRGDAGFNQRGDAGFNQRGDAGFNERGDAAQRKNRHPGEQGRSDQRQSQPHRDKPRHDRRPNERDGFNASPPEKPKKDEGAESKERGDLARLKSAMRDNGNPEGNTGAESSIFGLPGSRYKD